MIADHREAIHPRFSVLLLGPPSTATDSGSPAGDDTRASVAQQGPPTEILDVADAHDGASVADAVGRARGDFVCFLGAGDRLHPEALERIDAAAEDGVDLVYTDEDERSADGRRHDPFFKPDWSPTRLFAQPYLGRLAAYRRTTLLDADGIDASAGPLWEWDLMLRVSAQARAIRHVPEVLYHRDDESSAPDLDATTVATVLAPHLRSAGIAAHAELDSERSVVRIRPRLDETPKVSIVIPTAGGARLVRGESVVLVRHCVESVLRDSTYPDYEIVCVADATVNADLRSVLVGLDPHRVRIVNYEEPFNFSAKINLGAISARGDYVVMLNDDMEVIAPDWIESMLAFARVPEIGAVGAKLRFADGRIQHAGVLFIEGDPGHAYYGFPNATRGYHDNLLVPIDCSAVTAACLMSRRDVFEEVGGLSPQFPINYNDVDYCLKVRAKGYRIVHTPEAELYHFESSTRPAIEPDDEEHDRLGARWSSVLACDPYYNPNFLRTAEYLALVLPNGETDVDVRRAAGVPSRRGRAATRRRSAP